MDAFTYEQEKLKVVLDKLANLKEKLKRIPRYYGRDIVEQALDDQRQNHLKNLEIAQVEPYFGRLDFQESGTNTVVPLYIGKAGVQDDQTNELLVIDWRAPISSMFYSFTGQDASVSYTSPDGVVTGDIFLKRDIVIRKQMLQRVVDSYVRGEDNARTADEFLLYRLGENKDNRLQDIVSMIQQEQDQIIRADYNKALIIQGVPGRRDRHVPRMPQHRGRALPHQDVRGREDLRAHAKKLVAYSGIDPSVYASGKFIATSNHITKRDLNDCGEPYS